jgi:tetratricopeptide (TPR) repeat protein
MRAANRPAQHGRRQVQMPPVPERTPDAALLLAQARNTAFAEAAQGRLGHGLGVLYDALQNEPMSHELLSDMAALLLSAGKLDHAAAYAERALAIQVQHGPSLYTLAFALSGRGETDRAIGVLNELCAGPGRDSLQAEAPELIPVAMIELERLRRLRGTDLVAA